MLVGSNKFAKPMQKLNQHCWVFYIFLMDLVRFLASLAGFGNVFLFSTADAGEHWWVQQKTKQTHQVPWVSPVLLIILNPTPTRPNNQQNLQHRTHKIKNSAEKPMGGQWPVAGGSGAGARGGRWRRRRRRRWVKVALYLGWALGFGGPDVRWPFKTNCRLARKGILLLLKLLPPFCIMGCQFGSTRLVLE